VHTACPLTMYIIYYREIQTDGNEADWIQIPITQVKKTSYVIPLKCDVEYEIAMSDLLKMNKGRVSCQTSGA